MTIQEAVAKYKAQFCLNSKQLDFIKEMCYINTGMWKGDVNQLLMNEAKRDLALTLISFKDLKDEELIQLLEENGDSEWMIRTMTQLDK